MSRLQSHGLNSVLAPGRSVQVACLDTELLIRTTKGKENSSAFDQLVPRGEPPFVSSPHKKPVPTPTSTDPPCPSPRHLLTYPLTANSPPQKPTSPPTHRRKATPMCTDLSAHNLTNPAPLTLPPAYHHSLSSSCNNEKKLL